MPEDYKKWATGGKYLKPRDTDIRHGCRDLRITNKELNWAFRELSSVLTHKLKITLTTGITGPVGATGPNGPQGAVGAIGTNILDRWIDEYPDANQNQIGDWEDVFRHIYRPIIINHSDDAEVSSLSSVVISPLSNDAISGEHHLLTVTEATPTGTIVVTGDSFTYSPLTGHLGPATIEYTYSVYNEVDQTGSLVITTYKQPDGADNSVRYRETQLDINTGVGVSSSMTLTSGSPLVPIWEDSSSVFTSSSNYDHVGTGSINTLSLWLPEDSLFDLAIENNGVSRIEPMDSLAPIEYIIITAGVPMQLSTFVNMDKLTKLTGTAVGLVGQVTEIPSNVIELRSINSQTIIDGLMKDVNRDTKVIQIHGSGTITGTTLELPREVRLVDLYATGTEIVGPASDLPTGPDFYWIRTWGNSHWTGAPSDFNTTLKNIHCSNKAEINGDLNGFHDETEAVCLSCSLVSNLFGNLSSMPALKIFYSGSADGTLDIDIDNVSSDLRYINIVPTGTFTGNIGTSPCVASLENVTITNAYDATALTGDLFNCVNLITVYLRALSNVSMNFDNMPANLATVHVVTDGVVSITAGTTITNSMGYFHIENPMDTTTVDNLLIALSTVTWSGSKTLSLATGGVGLPSPASDAARAILTSAGVTLNLT